MRTQWRWSQVEAAANRLGNELMHTCQPGGRQGGRGRRCKDLGARGSRS